MEDCIKDITAEFPGRETYLKELFQLFGHRSHSFPSSVFVCGASGTGKSAVLLRLLDYLNIQTSLIDCIECYTSKIFYETIINDLAGHVLSSNNNFENYAVCDSTEDFLDILNTMNTDKSFVIVLKNFPRLHEIDANILPIMMRLQTLAPALNITCILIGPKSKLDHISKQGLMPCIELHCEQYGKNELLKILSLQIDHLRRTMIKLVNETDENDASKKHRINMLNELDDNFFMGYFDLFLNTFYAVCRNTKELLYLSNANFPIYCKPVVDGDLQPTDLRKLWKNMELPFKTAMNTIYCRVDQNMSQATVRDDEYTSISAISSSIKNEVQQLELPFYTKYLLIAAYLASHNDAKIDKRLFVKHHGKQRKRLQNVRANAMVSEKFSTQIGPKSFNIDRLMAIFYAINADKVSLTSDLLMQISNLVRLKYLTFVSGENNVMDGTARLQCNVTLNFISMVGKQVGFNVRQYLSDFI